MSERAAGGNKALFARTAIIAFALVSIVSFVAYIVLSAYADELDPGQDGDEHALSRSAVGYAGIVRLLNAVSPGAAVLSRGDEESFGRSLNVITLKRWQSFNEDDFYNYRGPVLIVLPKWRTIRHDTRRGWVELLPNTNTDSGANSHLIPDSDVTISVYDEAIEIQLAQDAADEELTIIRSPNLSNNIDGALDDTDRWDMDPHLNRRTEPRLFENDLVRREITTPIKHLQTISGDAINDVLIDPKGRIILGRIPDTGIYILSEPDLLNNLGMADLSRAHFATDLINALKSDEKPVYFDLTKHGFQRTRNMLKLAFEPPFGAATLTAFIAALILAWRSGVRFGPSRREKRAYALGKRALADNSASLIRMAGREHRYGASYAALISRLAARATGAPRDLHGDALDRFLDRFIAVRRKDDASSIQDLRDAAAKADNRASLIDAARRLFQWKQELDRERR